MAKITLEARKTSSHVVSHEVIVEGSVYPHEVKTLLKTFQKHIGAFPDPATAISVSFHAIRIGKAPDDESVITPSLPQDFLPKLLKILAKSPHPITVTVGLCETVAYVPTPAAQSMLKKMGPLAGVLKPFTATLMDHGSRKLITSETIQTPTLGDSHVSIEFLHSAVTPLPPLTRQDATLFGRTDRAASGAIPPNLNTMPSHPDTKPPRKGHCPTNQTRSS